MALYDVKCEEHGVFELRHPINSREPMICPQCGAAVKIVIQSDVALTRLETTGSQYYPD